MTEKLRKAAEQALAQLQINRTNFRKGPPKDICKMLAGGNDDVIAELRAALAEQPAEQEPVAWAMRRPDGLILDVICPDEHGAFEGEYTVPLYTAPQPANRVPMTDEGVELVAQWLERQMTDTPTTGPMLAGAIRHAGAKGITGEAE